VSRTLFVVGVAKTTDWLPEPPRPGGGPRRDRRPRRRALSRDAIVDATIRVLDAEGLDAVTMRRVAQELGTGGASLYAHVDNKDDLLELIRDRVIGEMHVPEPDPENWREQIKECVREMRRVFVAHSDLARVNLANIPLGPNAIGQMDRMLAILRTSGLPDQVIAFAADLLALYATVVAVEDSSYASRLSPEEAERYFRELGEYLHSLPADRFPNMAALAPAMMAGDPDERFEFGIEVLISGIEAQANRYG
jgi:AcrR family transcriptional regulator